MPNAGHDAWTEHRAIAEAITTADPDQAAEAMRTHLRNGLQRYKDNIG